MINFEDKTFKKGIKGVPARLIHFISYDIWRFKASDEIKGVKGFFIEAIRTIILSVRGFVTDGMSTKASALTYHTLLAIVPMLAVLLGIAKGFGLQGEFMKQLIVLFPGHETELEQAFKFVENYLGQVQGGIFLGIGFIILFYTVISLISSIEKTFNEVWQIKKSRVWFRRMLDYLAMFLLLPILMTISSGLSIYISTLQSQYFDSNSGVVLVGDYLLKSTPYIITVVIYTFLYLTLPNTRVKFKNALIAGIVSGVAFQFFQYIYINGQIWVSSYNAIYGSFAVLPLLLLWLHLSWLISLFGAELSYALQNVKKYSFDRDSRFISRRYNDFLILLIASKVVKRFARGEEPLTADQISAKYQIPIRITTKILYQLVEVGILIEVIMGQDDRVVFFQPAKDVNILTVGYLFSEIDKYGSENFKIDTSSLFSSQWKTILDIRREMMNKHDKILLKELGDEA